MAAGSCPSCGAVWTDLQYGHEPTPDEYVEHLRQVFHEAKRLLTPTATAWLNLGDSYSANSDGYHCARPGQYRQPRYRPRAGVPHKNLIGLPWRVAFAPQADGWILRNAVIWHKPNAGPFPVQDRLSNRHEMLFLLVRRPGYNFDLGKRYSSASSTRSTSAEPTCCARHKTVNRATRSQQGFAGPTTISKKTNRSRSPSFKPSKRRARSFPCRRLWDFWTPCRTCP